MRWNDLWGEFDVIAGPMPEIAAAAKQVMHLVWAFAVESQAVDSDLHPPGLQMMRVEVDDDKHDIREIVCMLTVTNEVSIVYGVEAQIPIAMQSGILVPYPIHPSD
jgi:hypothetical protein